MQWYSWLDIVHYKILSSYQRNTGHHALLIHNKWNNGEDVLIGSITRWLICSRPNTIKCCDICYDCQLMHAGNHPDYYQFDAKSNVQTIGVDVIRSCISFIYNHAYQSKVKIIFIKNVEYLTDQATNALLKVLEEPPTNTYFFFTTREYNKILSTLLSRCMQWSIIPPAEDIGVKWLMNEGIDDIVLATCALRLCNGAPIAAKDMLTSDFWNKRMMLCKNLYDAILHKNFLKILPFLNISNKTLSLHWLITILIDSAKWQQTVEKKYIINTDQMELIITIASRWTIYSLNKQLQQWLIVLYYFQKLNNINHQLLLTYRLLNWQYNVIEHCLNSWDI